MVLSQTWPNNVDSVLLVIFFIIIIGTFSLYFNSNRNKKWLARRYFKKLISENYEQISEIEKEKLFVAFKKWQNAEKNIHNNASADFIKLLITHQMNGGYKLFEPNIKNEVPHCAKVFVSNAFTDSVCSNSDAYQEMITRKFAEIMILSGIKPKKAHHFFVKIEKYLVNHNIKSCRIMFSIYHPI